MNVYIVTGTDEDENKIFSVHRSEAGAKAALREILKEFWDENEDEPMPDDLDEALTITDVTYTIESAELRD